MGNFEFVLEELRGIIEVQDAKIKELEGLLESQAPARVLLNISQKLDSIENILTESRKRSRRV